MKQKERKMKKVVLISRGIQVKQIFIVVVLMLLLSFAFCACVTAGWDAQTLSGDDFSGDGESKEPSSEESSSPLSKSFEQNILSLTDEQVFADNCNRKLFFGNNSVVKYGEYLILQRYDAQLDKCTIYASGDEALELYSLSGNRGRLRIAPIDSRTLYIGAQNALNINLAFDLLTLDASALDYGSIMRASKAVAIPEFFDGFSIINVADSDTEAAAEYDRNLFFRSDGSEKFVAIAKKVRDFGVFLNTVYYCKGDFVYAYESGDSRAVIDGDPDRDEWIVGKYYLRADETSEEGLLEIVDLETTSAILTDTESREGMDICFCDGEYIYFVCHPDYDGLYRLNVKTGKCETIETSVRADDVSKIDGMLYFLEPPEKKLASHAENLFRVGLDGSSKPEKV